MRIRRAALAFVVGIIAFHSAFATEPAPAPASQEESCTAATAPAQTLPEILNDTPAPALKALCPGSFCADDEDCQAACPSALTATCSGSTCHYTYSGSGGGGGGGSCPRQFCSQSSQCVCNGVQGTCVGFTCSF